MQIFKLKSKSKSRIQQNFFKYRLRYVSDYVSNRQFIDNSTSKKLDIQFY